MSDVEAVLLTILALTGLALTAASRGILTITLRRPAKPKDPKAGDRT